MKRISAVLLACAVSFGGAPAPTARAQVQGTYDGCMLMGRQVASIPDPSIDDIARAGMSRAYGPVILYNPAIVNRARPATRTFFYFHECAHHALGHTLGFAHPQASEQQADCWAVRELMGRRLFSTVELRVVQDEVATSPSSGRTTQLAPRGRRRAPALAATLAMRRATSAG